MIKAKAIFSLYSTAVNVIDDETAYDAQGNLVTYDKAIVQAYIDSNAYIAKRASEYPPITDYLDGVVKGDQTQIDKYIADCLAVKAKYPKVTT
jgi:hypothetical protein